jgi:hypothetical protein
MIACLTRQSLEDSAFEGASLDLDKYSNSESIFLIRRNEVNDLIGAYIEPITSNVEMRLMRFIDGLQQLDRVDLYHTFASLNGTRVIAGLLYESLGHAYIKGGITLTLKRMKCTKALENCHWKIQGGQQNPDDSGMPIIFPPNTAVIYEELTSVQPNQLYVPRARNQVAFLILDSFLYIFQFTVLSLHDIKTQMDASLHKLLEMLPPMEKWRFVFLAARSMSRRLLRWRNP